MADIHLAAVSKSYGGRAILESLELELKSGECFTILGPSGCGKSVILRLIAGFETPDAGTIRIGDRVVADSKKSVPPEERRIGVVFQDYAVWPHKTVYDNIRYPLEIAKVPKQELNLRVEAAIEQVNLSGLQDRLPYQLSGGQQQRVALARALVSKPDVMLLDEPLTNLDANLREEMRFEIKELQRRTGSTILYVTHDQEVALAISDRLAVMDSQGHIRQIGTPEYVYQNPADEFVFTFLGISNFIPVTISGDRARVIKDAAAPDGTEATGPELPIAPPAAFRDGAAKAACRPMDVALSRDPSGPGRLSGRILRTSLLGSIVDYLVELDGFQLRAQIQTEEAVASGLVFEEGSACGVGFYELKWFPADSGERSAQ